MTSSLLHSLAHSGGSISRSVMRLYIYLELHYVLHLGPARENLLCCDQSSSARSGECGRWVMQRSNIEGGRVFSEK